MPTWYLQKTLTSAGNSFGFSGTNIQFNFDPILTKVEEKITKKYVGDILRPYNTSNMATKPSTNILVDTKQMQWDWTITGVLTNDTGNLSGVSPTTVSTAKAKKNLLIAFAEQGLTMTWVERNSSLFYNVNIMSIDFIDEECEVNTYGGTAEETMKDNEVRIRFSMTLRKCVDRGG